MKRPAEAAALPPAWEAKLRAGRVKVTPNRRRVLGRFLGADTPWTLQSLHRSLAAEDACELSSVYRALAALRAAGLLEEYRLPGKRETFYSLLGHAAGRKSAGKTKGHSHLPGLPHAPGAAHAHGHHHHIVCEDCGAVSHLELCVSPGLLGKVEEASGFRITEHHLEFQGLCGACR